MQMFSQERVLTKGHVKSIFSNYHAQLSKYDASNIGRIMYSFQGLSQEVPEVIQELIKYLNSQIKQDIRVNNVHQILKNIAKFTVKNPKDRLELISDKTLGIFEQVIL